MHRVDTAAHEGCQNPIFLSYLPRGLLLRAQGAKWVLPEEKLPPLREGVDRRGLFMLNYTTDTFDFQESTSQEVMPGVFKQVKQTHRVRRTQFMAVPATVRTVHISQGEEWDALVGDCSLPPKMDLAEQWLANYVILSRAKTLEGLLLLRLPPRSFFSIGAPAHIVDELERLHEVEVASQERLNTYVRNLPEDVSIPACVTEALAVAPPKVTIKKCEGVAPKATSTRKSSNSAATIRGKRIAATLRIQERYLHLIEKGDKKVEARIYKDDVKRLVKGDLVALTTGSRLLVAEIDGALPCATFMELFNKVGFRNVLPGCKSKKAGVAHYHSFPNYAQDEKKHGVVALVLKVRPDMTGARALASSRSASVRKAAQGVGEQAKASSNAAKSSGAPVKSQTAPVKGTAKQGGGGSSSASKTADEQATPAGIVGSTVGLAANDSSASSPSRSALQGVGDKKNEETLPRGIHAMSGSASSSNAPPADARADPILEECDKCGQTTHATANCPYFTGRERVNHEDAVSRGSGPHCRGKLPKYEDIMKGTTAGTASAEDCNCLIHTLRQLIDPSAPDTCAKQIRESLRKRFKGGPDKVTASNYLTFDVHWRHIVELLGRDPNSYKITCVDLDCPGNGEVVGNLDETGNEGIVNLYIARENGNHFVPRHKKNRRFGRLS